MSIYTPTDWINNTTPAINEGNLNHLEDGVETAHTELQTLEDGLRDGTFPITTTRDDVHSVDNGGGSGTLRINMFVFCTSDEYDALTPDEDCCYLVLGIA